MKMSKKILSVLLACSMLLALTACGEVVPTPELLDPIETEDAVFKVTKGDLVTNKIVTGTVVPETVDVKLDFNNDAYDIRFSEGDTVKKGDIILKLNDNLSKSIAEMELNLSVTETKYNLEKENYNTQVKDLNKQYSAFKNAGDSYSAGMIKIQISQLEADFTYNHQEMENRISKMKEDIEKMKLQLEESEVIAPCDGTILYLSVSEDGDTITADKTFLTIAVSGTKRLSCEYIEQEEIEALTECYAQINGKKYDVSYIPFTEEELFYLDLQSGTKYCYFTSENLDDVNYGDYVIYTMISSVKDVLYIPTQSLSSLKGNYYVKVVNGESMEQRTVTIGESNLNYTEITAGLSENEVVFVAKDLARYSVKYETTKAEIGSIDLSQKITGVTREAEYLHEFTNPVPGKIGEILITAFSEVFVEKGQALYTVEPSISDAEWQQTKVDLKNAQKDYEARCEEYTERIKEKKKEIKSIKNKLELQLANFELDELQEEYDSYIEDMEEYLKHLEERIANFEEWSKGTVTIYAEEDGIIESMSSLKEGKEVAEDEYICGFYSSEIFHLSASSAGNMLRYGMKVEYQSRPEIDLVTFPATVTKSPLVMANDVKGVKIEAQLDDPTNYKMTASNGYLVYSMSLDNILLLSTKAIQYGEPSTEESSEEDASLAVGQPYVYVYDDNQCIVKRNISIVTTKDGYSWVSDGITADDVIVMP